ncbi:MAG: hydrogenase maturation nickel metallochaperone HypA [Spirochaetes bacterium]|nr:hydrogenase maturation nickel metallochaperone HypA [Spirochaetota bacterium]
MHELSITQTIVSTVIAEAEKRNAVGVKKINIVVGELTGFMADSIEMYYNVIAKGTIAEGAAINITFVPSRRECIVCGSRFLREPFSFTCPSCGGESKPTDEGSDCYIETIEITLPDAKQADGG